MNPTLIDSDDEDDKLFKHKTVQSYIKNNEGNNIKYDPPQPQNGPNNNGPNQNWVPP